MTNSGTFCLPAEANWGNWAQHFTDAQLWRPVVKRICRKAGIFPAADIAAGYPGTCAVWVVDSKVVVKVFPPFLRSDFDCEREVYGLLGKQLACMPDLVGEGIYSDLLEWPYLILEYRPGKAIREVFDQINRESRMALAVELGSIIRAIHATTLNGAVHLTGDREAWQLFLDNRRQHCVTKLRQSRVLNEEVVTEVVSFLRDFELLQTNTPIRLLNGDLTEDHLLLIREQNSWRISALIDWADAEAGTPEYEWVVLWFGLCGRDREMFRTVLHSYDPSLKLDEAYRWRLLAHTLLHRFGLDIIAHVWEKDGRPAIGSLDELLAWLWPVT